ncbi:MAG: RnfABCDGE type electron transport complex subunit D [Lautropia sp.]
MAALSAARAALQAARAHAGAIDPRALQIAFLSSFLAIGLADRDFPLEPAQLVLGVGAALCTQLAWIRHLRLDRTGVASALVSALGIGLLVRADNLVVHPLLACIAISSKFVLRLERRHLFNPANLAAVLAATALPGAWVSSGQWGHDAMVAAWFVLLGCWVALRSRRLDGGLLFLGCWTTLLVARAVWLGHAPAVVLHQLTNGALLLFAFFMITDPLTSPSRTLPRLIHAGAVALLAFGWQYLLYRPNGLLLALFALAPFVAWLEHRWPGERWSWRACTPTAGARAAAFAGRPGPQPKESASTDADGLSRPVNIAR